MTKSTISKRQGYAALLCATLASGMLLMSPISAAAQRPASCDATIARITLGKAYRLWVERQCKQFRRLRAGLGRLPDITTADKFAENGQDYADHEESIDRLLIDMAQRIVDHKAPNRNVEKGMDRWFDALRDWYQANESLVGEIRQGSLDFHTFVQRYGQVSLLKIKARKIAKRLGLPACASI